MPSPIDFHCDGITVDTVLVCFYKPRDESTLFSVTDAVDGAYLVLNLERAFNQE